jgi:hypothetical protein
MSYEKDCLSYEEEDTCLHAQRFQKRPTINGIPVNLQYYYIVSKET